MGMRISCYKPYFLQFISNKIAQQSKIPDLICFRAQV